MTIIVAGFYTLDDLLSPNERVQVIRHSTEWHRNSITEQCESKRCRL